MSGSAVTATASAASEAGPAGDPPVPGGDDMRRFDADFDLSSTFDVPAFLRRQEG